MRPAVLNEALKTGADLRQRLNDCEELITVDHDRVNTNIIGVQLMKYPLKMLEKLNEKLTWETVTGAERLSAANVQHGDLVAVPIDGGLYRGVICGLKDDSCSVYQLDFGAISEVPREDLYPLLKKFVRHPRTALRCRLTPEQQYIAYCRKHFIAMNLRKTGVDSFGIDLYEFQLETAFAARDESTASKEDGTSIRRPELRSSDLVEGSEEATSDHWSGSDLNSPLADSVLLQTAQTFQRPCLPSTSWAEAKILEIHPFGPGEMQHVTVQLGYNIKMVHSLISELFHAPELVKVERHDVFRGVAYVSLHGILQGARTGGRWSRVEWRQTDVYPFGQDDAFVIVDLIDYGVRMPLKRQQVCVCPEELTRLPRACIGVRWPPDVLDTVEVGQVILLKANDDNDNDNDDFVLVDVKAR